MDTKYDTLVKFRKDFYKFKSLEPCKGWEKRKSVVNEKALRLHNDLSELYFAEYNNLSVVKTKKMNSQKRSCKYEPKNLFL